MPETRIAEAMEMAAEGRSQEAIEHLWPLIRDEHTRPKTLFTLAFCFERDGNFATAVHVYRAATEAQPENSLAAERLAYCEKEVEALGLHEDFTDMGHADCPCGALRQRAEYGACPYCGISRDGEDTRAGILLDEPEEPLPGWDDPTFAERFDEAVHTTTERIREFLDRDEVKGVSDRAQKTTDAVADKVTEFLDSESVKEAARKVRAVSDEAVARAKKFGESESAQDIKDATQRLAKQTERVIEKLSEDERVQKATQRTRASGEKLLDRMRSFLKGDDKDKDGEGPRDGE